MKVFFQPKSVEYLVLFVFLIIAYVYCLIFAVYVNEHKDSNDLFKMINGIHESCVINCETNSCKKATYYRGSEYYIGSETSGDKSLSSCIMTYWSLVHFLFNMLLGFLFPNLLVEIATIGIVFEVYEYYQYDCHDLLDIFYNLGGMFIGYFLNKWIFD